MTEELKKRLEETADKYTQQFQCVDCPVKKECGLSGMKCQDFQKAKHHFVECVEYGYKEAIAQAKVWIRRRNRHACKEWLDKECADFEADMNKLWEGEK